MSRRRGRGAWQSGYEPQVRVRWVWTAIRCRRGGRLRVLIYARFSTDEQRRSSIKAQVKFCKSFLKALSVTNVEIVVLQDEALSGELRSRPGIDRVRAGVQEGEWDLILVEDSSRLYRDEVACVELVRLAVDKEVRVICINDYVDTADPDWEPRVTEAARHHGGNNRYTSERIKRSHEELWYSGAAIGLVKPGYRRKPSRPATEHDPAEGPIYDEVDPRWSPIIKGAYERIAGESPWSVARWLSGVGLPKAGNCHRPDWSDKNVCSATTTSPL